MELSEKPIEKQQIGTSLKVLIADDDPPTRILLRSAVAQWGYQVVDVTDGEKAWEILQQPDAPCLLILDWLMPKLDGAALCKRIKHELSSYHPYIILLTQMTGTANVIKALDAGADEFLSKPFNMAELRSRLSVGTRIVKYEKILAEKNNELKAYSEQMEKLAQERVKELIQHSDLLTELSFSVLDISQEICTTLSEIPTGVKSSQLTRIQELIKNLKSTIDTIKKLKLEKKY